MSIIVKGMKMPKCCRECMIIRVDLKCYCGKTVGQKEWKSETRPEWCPLVALPDKHGELIDRQKLIEDNKHLEYPTDGKYRRDRAWAVGFNAGARHCNEHAVYAKTVIEAEDGT